MSHEFTKLSEVELLNEVPEGATAIAEVNGEIKRVPSTGLGGGGVKTAVIKSSDYDNMIAGLLEAVGAAPDVTYECINMTFEEAYQTMSSGEPLAAFLMAAGEGAMVFNCITAYLGTAFGTPCIAILATYMDTVITLYWTADGISTEMPGGGMD